jgi:hypothetical protein
MNTYHRCRSGGSASLAIAVALALGVAGCGGSSASPSHTAKASAAPAANAAATDADIAGFGDAFDSCLDPSADGDSTPPSGNPSGFDTAPLPSSLNTSAVVAFNAQNDYFYFMPSASVARQDAASLNANATLNAEATAKVYDQLMLVIMPNGVNAAKDPLGRLDRGLTYGVQGCLVTAGQQMTQIQKVSLTTAGFAAPADSGVPQLTAAENEVVVRAHNATFYCNDVSTGSLDTENPRLFPNVPAANQAALALLPLLASKPDATATIPADETGGGPETVRAEGQNEVSVLSQPEDRTSGCPNPRYLAQLRAALASAPI